MITRRSIMRGLFAAPAVVAASSLMPLRGLVMPVRQSIILQWGIKVSHLSAGDGSAITREDVVRLPVLPCDLHENCFRIEQLPTLVELEIDAIKYHAAIDEMVERMTIEVNGGYVP